MIPEKKGVYLDEDITVTFLEELQKSGGTRSAYASHRRPLKKGIKVDSYLLHFDPASHKYLDGEIYFDKPILALICNDKQLDRTDKLFALENVKYPQMKYRGLDGNRANNELDVLKFQKDRKKIGARFSIGTESVDQMRILILSE